MRGDRLRPGRFFGRELVRHELDDLTLVLSRHEAGARIPRHAHERPYLCTSAAGTYLERFGRRDRVCETGTVFVHPPGECHEQRHATAVISLNVELGRAWQRHIDELGGAIDRPLALADGAIADGGRRLLALVGDRDTPALALESVCWEIAAALAEPPVRRGRGHMPRWLRRAREQLDHGFAASFSLRELAAAAEVHPTHFAAEFRRFLGCSAGEYVRRRRLEHVRERLRDPSLSLAALATEAGFADQSHLTRAFKRFSGMTPSDYRRATLA